MSPNNMQDIYHDHIKDERTVTKNKNLQQPELPKEQTVTWTAHS